MKFTYSVGVQLALGLFKETGVHHRFLDLEIDDAKITPEQHQKIEQLKKYQSYDGIFIANLENRRGNIYHGAVSEQPNAETVWQIVDQMLVDYPVLLAQKTAIEVEQQKAYHKRKKRKRS